MDEEWLRLNDASFKAHFVKVNNFNGYFKFEKLVLREKYLNYYDLLNYKRIFVSNVFFIFKIIIT